MADYLKKSVRNAFFSFDTLYTYITLLLEQDTSGEIKAHSRKLRTVATYLKHVARDLVKGCDQDQMRALIRNAENYEMVIMPTSTAKGLREQVFVDRRDVDFLVDQVCGMCFMCELRGPETKKCPLRSVLLRLECETRDNGKSICPFASGVDT